MLTALAGMIAGAMSMAAGEYVSVSSQEDTEEADFNFLVLKYLIQNFKFSGKITPPYGTELIL